MGWLTPSAIPVRPVLPVKHLYYQAPLHSPFLLQKKILRPMRNPVHFLSDGRAESLLSFGASRREIDRERELRTVKIGLVRDLVRLKFSTPPCRSLGFVSAEENSPWEENITLQQASLCLYHLLPCTLSRMPPHILQLGRLLCSNYSPSVFLCRCEALCYAAVGTVRARCFEDAWIHS